MMTDILSLTYLFPPVTSPQLTARTMNDGLTINAFNEGKNSVRPVVADSLGGVGGRAGK